MSVTKLGKIAVIGLSTALIAGCSTTATDTSTSAVASDATTTTGESGTSSDQAFATGADAAVSSVIVNGKALALDGIQTVFYFDFDKSIVRPESREALAKHAEFLAANSDVNVVLEGHADERGTREYNIALGERRSKAVSRYLTIQGVSASQVESVSFGEEVPVAFGHDSSAWQLNRRVEIRYEK